MRRWQIAGLVLAGLLMVSSAASARVLLVGKYHGIRGRYRLIQAAVDQAKPGDWILVAPGDYKTRSSRAPSDASDHPDRIR